MAEAELEIRGKGAGGGVALKTFLLLGPAGLGFSPKLKGGRAPPSPFSALPSILNQGPSPGSATELSNPVALPDLYFHLSL